jgi:archaellum component FlaC
VKCDAPLIRSDVERFISDPQNSHSLLLPSIELLLKEECATDCLEAALKSQLKSFLGDRRLSQLPLPMLHRLFSGFEVDKSEVDAFIEFTEMCLATHHRPASILMSTVHPSLLTIGQKMRLLGLEDFDWSYMRLGDTIGELIRSNARQAEIIEADRCEISGLRSDVVRVLEAFRQCDRMIESLAGVVRSLEALSGREQQMQTRLEDMSETVKRLEGEVNRQGQAISVVKECATRVSEAVTKIEFEVRGHGQAIGGIEKSLTGLSSTSGRIEEAMKTQGRNIAEVQNTAGAIVAVSNKIDGDLTMQRQAVTKVQETGTRIEVALTRPVHPANPWVRRGELKDLWDIRRGNGALLYQWGIACSFGEPPQPFTLSGWGSGWRLTVQVSVPRGNDGGSLQRATVVFTLNTQDPESKDKWYMRYVDSELRYQGWGCGDAGSTPIYNRLL